MHEALTNGSIMTKRSVELGWKNATVCMLKTLNHQSDARDRDMFYKDPQLFFRQSIVDRYVDDIACTFGVQRHCLNVVSLNT